MVGFLLGQIDNKEEANTLGQWKRDADDNQQNESDGLSFKEIFQSRKRDL